MWQRTVYIYIYIIYIHRHIHEKDKMCLQVAPSARPVRQSRPGSPASPMTGGMTKRMGRRRWRRWRRRKRRQGIMGSAARSLRTVNTACDGRATSAGDRVFSLALLRPLLVVSRVCCCCCCSDDSRLSLAWGADIFFLLFFLLTLHLCWSCLLTTFLPQHLYLSPAALKIHQRSRQIVGRFLLEWDAALMLMFSNSCSDARYTANHMLCLFWFKTCRKPPVIPVLIEEMQETTCYACSDSRHAGNPLLFLF